MRKGIFIVSVLVPCLFITACTSNSVRNAGCDFVKGTSGNQAEREAAASRPGAQSLSKDNKDVGVGMLSAIFGTIFRPLTGNDDCL